MPESNLPTHSMNPTEAGVMRLLTNTGDRAHYCMAAATIDARERYQLLLTKRYNLLYRQGLVRDPRNEDNGVLEDYAKAWVLSGETIQMSEIPGLRRFGIIRELERPREINETPQEKTGISGFLDKYGVPIAGGMMLFSLHRLLSRSKNPAE